ncbi:MAG: hypothetical protein ABJF04_08710 [Reichenbachiella sp.]|uniref:hypothetical protein n=1 Tax=Reichenbachiella sp. TaxID=2184521 RepID=UPI003265A2C1
MHGSKLNQEATNTYSRSYSAKIIEDFFSRNKEISGQQIISLTPIKQVNFFVLKALFEEWQEEIKKFRSPYFDYKNDDVNQALKSFINTLSKHILIQKENFQPLLEKAVIATLELLNDPAKYYTQELSRTNAADKTRELKGISKYIKLHKALFDDLLIKLDKADNINLAIQQAVQEHSPSDSETEQIVDHFNGTLTLDVLEKQPEIDEILMPEPLDELGEDSRVNESSMIEDINDEFDPVDESQGEGASHSNVNQQYKEDIKTLNQRYEEKEKVKNLAAVHETKSMSDLKNNININQRYMFVNDLFEGNEKDYELAMDEVESCDSFDSSVELLVQNYAKKYAWDMNADEVKELLKVIFKRFR